MLRQNPAITLPCGKTFYGNTKNGKFKTSLDKIITMHLKSCKICREAEEAKVSLTPAVVNDATRSHKRSGLKVMKEAMNPTVIHTIEKINHRG